MSGKNYDTGNILIKNKKIQKIDSFIDISENDDELVIDANGTWTLPGLIDAHSHIGISEDRKGQISDNSNENTEPLTPYIRALDAINPMDSAFHNAIKAGITAVMVGPGSSNVSGGQFAFIKTHGRAIEDMVLLEPAAMKIAFGENPITNYGDNNLMPSSRMTIAAMLREELIEAKRYYEDKKAATANGDSFREDFRKECWLPIFKKEIPLKAHVHRADDIQTAIRIAKEFDLDLTLDHCSEGHLIAEKIRESGFPAIVGPSLASRNKNELQYTDFKTSASSTSRE